MNVLRVGETRPSQLLWNFGIGSVMDLRNLSVTVTGVDDWPITGRVVEPRLLKIVNDVFDGDVESLVAPPLRPEGRAFDPENRDGDIRIGVPVELFPKYLRCPRCNMLASSDSGLFRLEKNIYRPERNRYVHEDCPRKGQQKNWPTAVSARHLVACEGGGHIDDFPWHYYVHGGVSTCRGRLEFREMRGSTQAEDLSVSCTACGAYKTMAQAFGQRAESQLPRCRGHHPHLGTFEECDQPLRTLLLGATNTWFPITRSVLAIPSNEGPLTDIVNIYRDRLETSANLDQLKLVINVLKPDHPRLEEFTPEQIWEKLQEPERSVSTEAMALDEIKLPEWEIFTGTTFPKDDPDFQASCVSKPSVQPAFQPAFQEVVKVERLREVNALIGFTRVEAVDPLTELDPDSRGPISRSSTPKNVPAFEVRGEGIFLRFDGVALKAWSIRSEVKKHEEILKEGHRLWRESRQLENPQAGFPGMEYLLVHTFSHVLLREMAMECGYGAASLRERIYVVPDESTQTVEAGLLIYTAAPDSEGTLGGLSRLSNSTYLTRLIKEALERSLICSADPLCREHDPREDRTLHGATCHSCTLISETSCEMANRYLDRRLLVKTSDEPLGFFELGTP